MKAAFFLGTRKPWYIGLGNVLVRLRYTYHRPDGELLCDSGWVALPHSQPLTGTDIARALWPASGRVKAVGCEVTWSERELLSLVPMAITGGAA